MFVPRCCHCTHPPFQQVVKTGKWNRNSALQFRLSNCNFDSSSFGHHVSISCASFLSPLSIIWRSFGHHLKLIRATFEHRFGTLWRACGHQLKIKWAWFEIQLGSIWRSCVYHLTGIWTSVETGRQSFEVQLGHRFNTMWASSEYRLGSNWTSCPTSFEDHVCNIRWSCRASCADHACIGWKQFR